jgi:membrane protein implicated in regulation of membrane protease activity
MFWFCLALLLGIIELLVGANFFLIWLALCSSLVAIATYLFAGISLLHQFIIFTFSAIIILSYWIDYVRKNSFKFKTTKLNRRAEQLIGRKAILLEPVVNGFSKVKIDDSFWRVQFTDNINLAAGEQIEIIGVDKLILIVKNCN